MLASLGARPWQVELVTPVMTASLTARPADPPPPE
jgi:hypothetical protein